MILSILDYADLFYHYKNPGLLKKLQSIPNRTIRIISKLPRITNTENEERRLELLPLNTRRAIQIVQYASDIVYKQPNLTMTLSNSTAVNTGTVTRSQNPHRTQMKMFRPKKGIFERSISYTLRKAWNALPTWAHQTADKQTLASFLLATDQYIAF